ncbi:MAG: 16S rRNA (cytosine(967)-C(5))-methyltransferase RsmB [bacterium]
MARDREPITAREMALQILIRVETQGSYANLLLDKVLAAHPLASADRRFVTELVYGVLRHRSALDWIISHFSARKIKDMTASLRNILRLGVYQIAFLERIPAAAACNEAVELAKKHGHAGIAKFTNGVLRAVVRGHTAVAWPEDPLQRIAVRESHPAWLVERWIDRFGAKEAEALCLANNRIPSLSVRTNTLRITRAALKELLTAAGVAAAESEISPDGLRLAGYPPLRELAAFREGLFTVQDEASMLVAEIMRPAPGSIVIDTCSAPGGKTTHLAQKMDNRGKIIALDQHAGKLRLVAASCRRLGINIVETRQCDARQIDCLPDGAADAVLVDAPCSGLGVLRRKPDAKWRKTAAQLPIIGRLQRQILAAAAAKVTLGGTLLYSTCTTEPEENETVIADFLTAHSNFRPVDIRPFLPPKLREEAAAARGYLQLLPHRHGTDGFFIARLTRRQ